MKNPILLLALLFSVSFVYAQRSIGDHSHKKIASETEGWLSLKHKVCSIKYPKNWELDETGQQGTAFMLFSSLTGGNDQFRENVNLMVQDLSSYNLDLDAYTELSVKQVKDAGFKLISSKRLKNGCHEVSYTGTTEGYELQWKQHYWVRNNHAYVLTFTSEKVMYANYIEEVNHMFTSFQLK